MPESNDKLTIRRIDLRPCTICQRPIVDLPEAPLCCPEHDCGPTVHYGPPEEIGRVEGYDAVAIRQVGVFSQIVQRYERRDRPILGYRKTVTWIDPKTGRRMGRNEGYVTKVPDGYWIAEEARSASLSSSQHTRAQQTGADQ